MCLWMHEDIYICVDGFSFALNYLYCPLAMEIGLKVSVSYDKIRIVFLLFSYIIFILPFHTLYFCKMLIQFPMDDVKSTVRVSLSNYEYIAVFLQCKIRWCCCAHQSFLWHLGAGRKAILKVIHVLKWPDFPSPTHGLGYSLNTLEEV